MTSLVRGEDGAYGLEFGDGLPFGHELADALNDTSVFAIPRAVGRNLRLALVALQADQAHDETRQLINDTFAYQNTLAAPESIAGQARRNTIKWLSKAPYQKLGEFCLWNQQAQKLHQAGLSAVEVELQQETLRRAQGLVDVGYFPEHAVGAYEEAISKTAGLRAMDVFESGGMQASGYYVPRDNTIALANRFFNAEEFSCVTDQLQNTGFHEFTHAVGDTAVRGFMRISSAPTGYRWLEEAYVAHSTTVSGGKNGDAFTVDPGERSDLAPYATERELLHLLTNHGKSALGITDISEAYFAKDTNGMTVRRHVFSRLNKNIKNLLPEFKDSGLRGFSATYEGLYTNRQHDRWLQQNLQRVWATLGVAKLDLSDEVAGLDAVIRIK
jgi:hypothetical protein